MLADARSDLSVERGLFDVGTPVPRGARVQLTHAAQLWDDATQACEPAERFRLAHIAALRGAAAVLAARPTATGRRAGRPTSAWRLLDQSAPELAEWSAFFRDSAVRRAAVEAGSTTGIDARDAAEMLAAVSDFLVSVAGLIGMPTDPARVSALSQPWLRQAS